MGDIQHEGLPQQLQALHCQQHYLGDFVIPQVAYTFQACLENFPVIPVDVFIIIYLLDHARFLGGVLHDGQGHVRLQRQQPPPVTGEGDDLIRHQKILVPDVQIVFFKAAHLIGAVTVAAVKAAQIKDRPLLPFHQFRHGINSFPRLVLILYHFIALKSIGK